MVARYPMDAPLMRTRLLLLLLLVLPLGCAANPAAPVAPLCPAGPRVQVVDHGLHTGLVVSAEALLQRLPQLAEDFSPSGHIELGWGDASFYQADDPGAGQALRALFGSGGSVLHLLQIPSSAARYYSGATVLHLSLDAAGQQRLLDSIAATFSPGPDGRLRPLGPGLHGHSRFYPAKGRYSLFNTCNTWLVQALASAGLPLASTSVVTAKGAMAQLAAHNCIDAETSQATQ